MIKRSKDTETGFTLMELMIVIAIIGILASVAVPQYGRYTQRAKFVDIVNRTATYKTAVSLCAQEENVLADCTSGSNPNIPPNLNNDGNIVSLTTTAGIINVLSNTELGGHTYVLTPTMVQGAINWVSSGSCRTARYCPE